MKNKILLSQIFAAADAEKANAAPGAEDWTPSESFTRRVSALARGKRVRTRRLFDTAGRRAVAALFAVIIIVTAAMCVKAIREPVLELFANVFDTHTKFETSAAESSPPRELEVRYTLSYVPEGFVLEEKNDSVFDRELYYVDSESRFIIFKQMISTTGITADTEGAILEKLETGTVSGYYFINKGVALYIWTDADYVFELICTESITKDEVIKMINTIMPEAEAG